MIWRHYELDHKIMTTNDQLILWSSERGTILTDKDTLALAVTLDWKPQGYILSGKAKLILDTIIETDQGAVGKPIEKELTEPFLMLGNPQLVESHVSPLNREDREDFLAKAKDLKRRFFDEKGTLDCGCHDDHGRGLIFAFEDTSNRLDLLILQGSRLVYKAVHFLFVSDEHRVVLKNPHHTIVSDGGRCLIVR